MDKRDGGFMDNTTDPEIIECPNGCGPLLWYGGIEGVQSHFWCAECVSVFDEDLAEIGELRDVYDKYQPIAIEGKEIDAVQCAWCGCSAPLGVPIEHKEDCQ